MHTTQHNYAAHICTCKIICTRRQRGIIACSILQRRHAHCAHTRTHTQEPLINCMTFSLTMLMSPPGGEGWWRSWTDGWRTYRRGSGLACASRHPLTCSLFHPSYLVEHPHLYSVCTCARTTRLVCVGSSVCVWAAYCPKRILLCQMSHFQKGIHPLKSTPFRQFSPRLPSSPCTDRHCPPPLCFTFFLPPSLILFYPLFHSLELSLPHTLTSVCSHKHFAE